jgi:predicted ribosome quality control (RQC) complex YloA/Tae2 family protein
MDYLKNWRIFAESKMEKPNIKKITEGDFLILQGRDAVSNDYLTFEIADTEDYWFHAKGYPGSHVVIRLSGKLPDSRLIYKAAEIAAKNSSAKKAGKSEVNVVYCKRKFVTKRSGMNPGQVAVDEDNSQIIKVKL